MIQYPAGLPPPLQEGYGLSTVSPLVSTTMVTGRKRFRVRHSYVPTDITVNFIFGNSEASYFEAWFKRALNNGFEWFLCPLQTPLGFKMYEARFLEGYAGPDLVQIKRWRYSAKLRLKDKPYMPEKWDDFPEYWLGQDIIDIAINREWPEA
ncbi:hypothetical protein D3C76_398010 [compost metagenome]